MFESIIVHPRVRRRHPEISDVDAITAWRNAIAIQSRLTASDTYLAAGADKKGRMLELVGVELENKTLVIYHAMKLTKKMAKELGI